jgi:glycosyltransferase involved in cell wall biosynthesis
MPKISAVIITFNEELFIDKCLASLEGIADEIVVVDSFSTDATEQICKKYNVRFVKHEFEGFRDQKNYALKLATHKNILSLDADEALSDKLRESIKASKINGTMMVTNLTDEVTIAVHGSIILNGTLTDN